MARITTIRDKIIDLIKTIKPAGFSYTFGSVNPADYPNATYPMAIVSIAGEAAVPTESVAQYGYAIGNIQIKIVAQNTAVATMQTNIDEIEELYDVYIQDIKGLLLINGGRLGISTFDTVLNYQGFEKEVARNGDIFTPESITMNFTCLYQYA